MIWVYLLLGVILSIAVGVQVYSLVKAIKEKRQEEKKRLENYSSQVIEAGKKIRGWLSKGDVNKHTITNSAPPYESKRTLSSYRKFLQSQLMKTVETVKEERYNG